MAEYFHIPPEGGWTENTYYVCEVSTGYGNRIFSAIMYSGLLNNTALKLGIHSGVFIPLMDKSFRPLKDFKYIKAIRKIDMTIPNKGKQIKELNIFELKDHMKERPDVRFD